MTIKERYRLTLEYFSNNMPLADTELKYTDPFELIVAVILSAQCTDKRVNIVTPALMKRFPDAESMSGANIQEIYHHIKSCSYPNNKAKHLSGMAKMLVSDFGGQIPSDPGQLQKLPGVGRKTANVIASVIFKKPVMAVDTHVFRVSARIGLVRSAKTPRQTEDQLTRNIPPDIIHRAHHWLLLHGRYVCTSRNPRCGQCGLSFFCKYYSSSTKKQIN
jgi:endonuclease III